MAQRGIGWQFLLFYILGLMMKNIITLLLAIASCSVALAQASDAAVTSPQGTVIAPATKGDVKAAAKVEKAEIKAQEKIEKAVADAEVTSTKADANAAKKKAAAQAKADRKILAAKKDVAEAQIDANKNISKEHK